MKNIVILGSTGSVGRSTLDVVREFPGEFRIVGLVCRANEDLLMAQVEEFRPALACITDEAAYARLKRRIPSRTRILAGAAGMEETCRLPEADIVMAATSGSSALVPVLRAVESGKDVALANKEILVMAGEIISTAVRKKGVRLIPVDSEHNAIFQCLDGAPRADVARIILTGSGGPLREVDPSRFRGLKPGAVTQHPKWKMGKKISVDSATMMNKGLETIEAQWLFGVGVDQVKILVHPEAVVHSMVEFVDGSILAGLGPTDMRLPILHALSYPKRFRTQETRLRLEDIRSLHFMEPDRGKFPCLGLALEVARQKETTLAACLNAADEVAVRAFLEGSIDFADIPEVIESCLRSHHVMNHPVLRDVLETEELTRRKAEEFVMMKSRGSRVSRRVNR